MGRMSAVTYEKKVRHFAHELAAGIAALPASDSLLEATLNVFTEHGGSPDMLCSAFWLMDNEPGRFPLSLVWHPRLRSLRNHPIDGERLFALFS